MLMGLKTAASLSSSDRALYFDYSSLQLIKLFEYSDPDLKPTTVDSESIFLYYRTPVSGERYFGVSLSDQVVNEGIEYLISTRELPMKLR